MNADLLTDDLKKKRSSNESFWLVGQPDVEVRSVKDGEHKGKHQVEVHGFDYYNTRTGQIELGDTRPQAGRGQDRGRPRDREPADRGRHMSIGVLAER